MKIDYENESNNSQRTRYGIDLLKSTLPFNVFTATSTDVTDTKGAIAFRDSVIKYSGVSGSIKSANFARVASSLLSRGLKSSK